MTEMTIAELIAKLNELPQDSVIWVVDEEEPELGVSGIVGVTTLFENWTQDMDHGLDVDEAFNELHSDCPLHPITAEQAKSIALIQIG